MFVYSCLLSDILVAKSYKIQTVMTGKPVFRKVNGNVYVHVHIWLH